MNRELGEFPITKGVAAKKRTKYYKREKNSQPWRDHGIIWGLENNDYEVADLFFSVVDILNVQH